MTEAVPHGDRIQKYEILGPIGRGGMATVYLAYDEDLGRHVALKKLDLRGDDSELVERFMRESRMAAGLSHPNLVTVFARLEHEGVPYIAMEYLDRGSLRPSVGQLTAPQIFGVLEGTLAGLAHAHQNGLVHRDLKPENLLLTSGGAVKIADFGIAKAISSATPGLTKRGAMLGTPAYMAPEQVTKQPVGPPADLYSLGVIAFELFCGRVPFEDNDEPMAVLFRHVNEPAPPPQRLRSDLDPRLSRWIEGLLAKPAADRPQDAETAWEELEDIVVSLHGPTWRREARLAGAPDSERQASVPLTPAEFPEDAAPARRRPLRLALAAGTGVALIALLVVLMTRSEDGASGYNGEANSATLGALLPAQVDRDACEPVPQAELPFPADTRPEGIQAGIRCLHDDVTYVSFGSGADMERAYQLARSGLDRVECPGFSEGSWERGKVSCGRGPPEPALIWTEDGKPAVLGMYSPLAERVADLLPGWEARRLDREV